MNPEEEGIEIIGDAAPFATVSSDYDDILDVTPVASFESDELQQQKKQHQQQRAKQLRSFSGAFSSDSDSDDDDDDTEDHVNTSNEAAIGETKRTGLVASPTTSEWDKALLSGVHSKARVTSDMFAVRRRTEQGLRMTNDRRDVDAQNDSAANDLRHHQTPPVAPQPPPPPALPPQPASEAPPAPSSAVVSSAASTTASEKPLDNKNLSSHNSSNNDLSSGILPDVFLNMRQQIESMTLFDSDMMKLAEDDDPMTAESRESLKRSSQQSISPAVLVSLAHKRYERRRLAAMEIEKVVRSLVQQTEWERVKAILLLLSDDYVRSTSEDARKGGVVALAACAIGIKKKASEECQDLILASVVHACQDHYPRVRYYATESLFNVVKVLPTLAIQHFFILFEILRSLYADVDGDVRSGAELLDKKLKELILSAMNSGAFTVDACVPVFARFVHMHNKATKLLTLTWLQELNEKLVGAPVLPYLHLLLGGIFDMVADPTIALRQSALAFLQSILPKLLTVRSDHGIDGEDEDDDRSHRVDFDKILQSLVTTMEHPDPFVRKVAMYWMSRIVKAHMSVEKSELGVRSSRLQPKTDKSASVSVRNSVPHLLPGILLCIGDSYNASASAKDSFLPDQTTRSLAEQTNRQLQDAVRRDGNAYIHHLDAFVVALQDELDAPGGIVAKNPPAVERTPYRMDVTPDGSGIETPGWFRASADTKERNGDAMVQSRLCALDWVIVLYDTVVPVALKADYAREFIYAIIQQLGDNPSRTIVQKSLEVLARVTIPVVGEDLSASQQSSAQSLPGFGHQSWLSNAVEDDDGIEEESEVPMTDSNIEFALQILSRDRSRFKSRDRRVFSALIELHFRNEHLLANFSNVLTYMCTLQPPEFVFVSFSVEVDRFVRRKQKKHVGTASLAAELGFVSSLVQHMSHVLIHAKEAKELREELKECISRPLLSERDRQRTRLFHILLHSFAHNIAAVISLCLWSGAYGTASKLLIAINPLDINLMTLLEIDKVVEMLERPFLRHLHVRMLEKDADMNSESSGTMLFRLFKSMLMILPQGTCYNVLKDRLTSVARFRQSALSFTRSPAERWVRSTRHKSPVDPEYFVTRIQHVRALHCSARWHTIRADSLEVTKTPQPPDSFVPGTDRRSWLGYASADDEVEAKRRLRALYRKDSASTKASRNDGKYQDLGNLTPLRNADDKGAAEDSLETTPGDEKASNDDSKIADDDDEEWKAYWIDGQK